MEGLSQQSFYTERSRRIRVKVINDIFNNNFSNDQGGLRSELVMRKWSQEISYTVFIN